MKEYPYLVAIALIEQNELRAMPIGGKSLNEPIKSNAEPGKLGEDLAKELLIRIFQRSEEGPLKRAAENKSLLLIQIGMQDMQEKLPLLKADWIKTGDNERFLSEVYNYSDGIWSLTFSRENGIVCSSLEPS